MRILQLSLLSMLTVLAASVAAAPQAELWERWTRHASSGSATIDHSEWDAFLSQAVRQQSDGVNRIAYAKIGEADKQRIRGYLSRLAAVGISEYSRNEQRAFWINLYNALTVLVVLDHYPVASIKDISSGFFSAGPWKKKLIRIEGEELTLDDIEHRILRPIWKDPRIHYAVNCAAIGCPNLMPSAYTSGNAEALLDQGAKDYVNSGRGARFDNEGRLIASSIYKWFKDDFGGDDAGVIAHVSRYAQPSLAARLADTKAIADYGYDWGLNDAAPVRKQKKPRVGSSGDR